MADYIRREDAIEEIDKWLDAVGTVFVGKNRGYYGEVIGCIKDAPAADVAPVVRCEKCLYRSQYANKDGFYKCGVLGCEGEDCAFVSPDFGCIAGVLRGKQMDGGIEDVSD